MKILVTGAAGFIGFHYIQSLMKIECTVVGIDNINNYYDINLKNSRLKELGINIEVYSDKHPIQSSIYPSYRFIRMDINDSVNLNSLFEKERFTHVMHLAAQAGVRYSIQKPFEYIDANIKGFMHLIEACRHYPVEHLVYASSSSVYGANINTPYKETDQTDHPISLYAATKKANEVMAHAYSKLYNIPSTGVRFFTVYGPWGRPDMSPYLFMNAILKSEPIKLFNHGNMERDFTFVGDVSNGLIKIIASPPKGETPYAIYNIGCSSPVRLTHFISVIENITCKKAIIELTDMQPGDMASSYADTSLLYKDFNYKPSTAIEEGLDIYYKWFTKYYK